MAARRSRRRPETARRRAAANTRVEDAIRVAISSGEIISVGVVNLVKSTLVTALAGAQDVGAQVGTAAVAAVRGTIAAASDIGADLGMVAKQAIRGTIQAAGEIGGDLGSAANAAARGAVRATGEVGGDVTTVARKAIEGTAEAARELRADVGRLIRRAARGAVEAADRISTAAGTAVRKTVDEAAASARKIADPPAPPALPPAPRTAAPRKSRARTAASSARRTGTRALAASAVTLLWFCAVHGAEIDARYLASDDTLLRMGRHVFAGGKTLDLTVGIGSAAFRHPGDPPDVLWTLGDRGPNIACGELQAMAGVELPACREVRGGRVYPSPSYAPSIYRVLIGEAAFRVTDVITLKDRDGRPLNGLPNPLRTATTETPLDGSGQRLAQDVHGIDAEGLVRLADGSFWVGEENGPSLAHFSPEGRMITRHVPRGTEGEYAGARYAVVGTLPAILTRRQANRGIESVAISPDERFLYFIMQNPLANPDAAAYRQARNTRLFKLERATMQTVAEYVYTLDDPRSFRRDPSSQASDPRISELMGVGPDRLVVLERTEQTTKLYEIDLGGATDIAGSRWDDPATRPTLEQVDVTAAGIVPVTKTLRLDTADFPAIVGKTEGMALLGDGALALVNDDDFGIAGGRTQIVVLRGTGITRR